MKVVISQEHEVNGCCDCPYAQAHANWDSYDEDDYRCHATSDRKLIDSYVFVKSDLPKYFPEWCPLRQKKACFDEVMLCFGLDSIARHAK